MIYDKLHFDGSRWACKRSLATMGKPYCYDRIHSAISMYKEYAEKGHIAMAQYAMNLYDAARERIKELNTARQWPENEFDKAVLALPLYDYVQAAREQAQKDYFDNKLKSILGIKKTN